MKKTTWKYGDTPPENWADAAALLKQIQKPKNELLDRLSKIETLLKEKEK
jgi:hypothetical protein